MIHNFLTNAHKTNHMFSTQPHMSQQPQNLQFEVASLMHRIPAKEVVVSSPVVGNLLQYAKLYHCIIDLLYINYNTDIRLSYCMITCTYHISHICTQLYIDIRHVAKHSLTVWFKLLALHHQKSCLSLAAQNYWGSLIGKEGCQRHWCLKEGLGGMGSSMALNSLVWCRNGSTKKMRNSHVGLQSSSEITRNRQGKSL